MSIEWNQIKPNYQSHKCYWMLTCLLALSLLPEFSCSNNTGADTASWQASVKIFMYTLPVIRHTDLYFPSNHVRDLFPQLKSGQMNVQPNQLSINHPDKQRRISTQQSVSQSKLFKYITISIQNASNVQNKHRRIQIIFLDFNICAELSSFNLQFRKCADQRDSSLYKYFSIILSNKYIC